MLGQGRKILENALIDFKFKYRACILLNISSLRKMIFSQANIFIYDYKNITIIKVNFFNSFLLLKISRTIIIQALIPFRLKTSQDYIT